MPRAIDLLRQGKNEELWQMCCGYLSLDIGDFMEIQERLLTHQLELLAKSPLGDKLLHGHRPRSIEEFRSVVPLTTYKDYCPELLEKREDVLPVKPARWAHSSGWSSDYPCKWVPISEERSWELSRVLYGVGMMSSCSDWGDTSRIPDDITILYSVAPRPYISGTFADILFLQTSINYLPNLEEAENTTFEERIKLGLQQALSEGMDYFFGLSLVLVSIGEKFRESSSQIDIRSYLKQPKALFRLAKGLLKSRLARRAILPRDLWSLRGIISSGLDSWVYKERVKELWGRYPLDLYSCTEGGVIATQTWDYEGMCFVPSLNFLEFIPEEEHFKWQMDRSYQPLTLSLDEVKAGENYELVITNFHGGALVRYRIGDMVRITALQNSKLGIKLPQMVFERRTDDMLDFVVVKLTEKRIWQALEITGIAYEDWVAYKIPGESVLHLLIEPKSSMENNEQEWLAAFRREIMKSGTSFHTTSATSEEWRDSLDFDVEITFLPRGSFAEYTAQKQSEGADPAHLKPPHINPPDEVLSRLWAGVEETIVVKKVKTETETANIDEDEIDKITL